MTEILQRLRERKLVQWALAYVAAAFALIQVLDVVGQQFGWSEGVRRGITIALGIGFFVTLVLAWYHGDKGAQKVTGKELLVLTAVLVLGGGVLWHFERTTPDDLASAAGSHAAAASQVSDKNPSVAPPLKVSDCSQITDGSAALILVSAKYLERHGLDKAKFPRLLGFGSATDYLALDKKDAPTFSTATKAADKAFGMAGLKPRDMHGVEVHDCFSITEIVAYEILGLAARGKGAELAMSGATALPQVRNEKVNGKIGWEIPVNAGGGLIGDGHPVGATGVRQVLEAYQQLTGQADARQVANARKYLTFNMGGSLTTSVAMIWGRD